MSRSVIFSVVLCSLVVTVSCAEGVSDETGTSSSSGTGGGSSGTGGSCTPLPADLTEGTDCTAPIDLGTFADSSADLTEYWGNGMPANRSLWLAFWATDDPDTDGDEYHVDVRFLTNPDDAYQMDVFRGSCDNQLASGETDSFDWYVDFQYTEEGCPDGELSCGEGNCVPEPIEGSNTCDDDTSSYFVRIKRTDGQASCDEWQLEISNGLH